MMSHSNSHVTGRIDRAAGGANYVGEQIRCPLRDLVAAHGTERATGAQPPTRAPDRAENEAEHVADLIASRAPVTRLVRHYPREVSET